MPRGNIVIPQRHRPIQQRAELQAAVAVDAGVGRAARAVLRHKMIHHIAAKGRHFIKYIELHAQPIRHGPGILGIVGAAAAAVVAGDQLEHGAVALITLLPQQQRRSRAVHPAGHGHQHPLSLIAFHRFTSLYFGTE